MPGLNVEAAPGTQGMRRIDVESAPTGAGGTGRGPVRYCRDMADIPIETFEKEAADFLDTHASLKEEEKEFVWGEGSDKVALFDEKSRRARGRRPQARPRRGGPRSSTPASAGSPARRRTAAASFPTPTSGRYGALEGALRGARTRASSASASAWWRPRSSPTPPHDREGRLPDRRCTAATSSPASCSASRARAPTSPASQTHGRARRRRVDHHRPEGVDVGRAVHRHRRDHLPHRPRPAQAQGPHRLRRRHARARRRGAARCGR